MRRAVDHAFANGARPYEIGGTDGTATIAARILDAVETLPAVAP
jgi:hypothetical protein